jgi:putative copper export protein
LNFRIGTRLWSGLLVLLVLFWALGLFAVQQYPGLPTPPELTLWGLPALRYTRDIASMLTIGTLVVGAFLILGHSSRVLRWALGWVAIWFVTLVALTAFTLSDIEAISPFAALNPNTWWPFLSESYVGRVFAFQLISVAILWALLASLSRRVNPRLSWVALVLSLSASAAPALLGHGGFSTEHVAMTISLGIHIAAVSLWVGGLAACVAALVLDRTLASTLMPRFSLLALWCVVVLAETGLLNASLRVGTASSFVGSTYGSLVLVKAVLLGWLVWFGWQQRSKVLPKLTHSSSVTPAIGKYAGLEFLLMAVAIAVSITLSRIGFESTTASTGSFTPTAIVVLALIGPLLLITVKPFHQTSGKLSSIRNYPEFASVVLIVAIIEVCGIGLTEVLFGVEIGVIVGSILLFVAGWLWSVSLDGSRRKTGVIMVMVGFPVALLLADALAENATDWHILSVVILVAEAILSYLLIHHPAAVHDESTSSDPAHV